MSVWSYEEYLLRPPSTSIGVLLSESYELLGESLGFFGFGPGGFDGFMGYEGGDEVSKEGLPVGGAAVEMAVFHMAASHCVRVDRG